MITGNTDLARPANQAEIQGIDNSLVLILTSEITREQVFTLTSIFSHLVTLE